MFAESPPFIRRLLRFLLLPYCYFKLVNWKECTRSKTQVLNDFLYIFFRLKYYPDNYGACRFWEKERSQWNYYYGSSYDPYQRKKLRREVQRYEYQILFNDKEICDLLCRGMDVSLPRFLGKLEPDTQYREDLLKIFNDTKLSKVIIKPVLGHAGLGILLAKRENDSIAVKSKAREYPLKNFVLKEKCIVQEIVGQDETISSIAPHSINTIRLLTLYTKSQEVIIVSSTMRFGVGESFVDNWSAGGVAVGVDHETGILKKTAYDKPGNQYYKHPVSQIVFSGFRIPRWENVKEMAIKIQKACPFYKLLGLDIAVTENGPVLIEVNANPDIIFQEQTSGPLFASKKIYDEFKKYDLLINKYQEQLYQ